MKHYPATWDLVREDLNTLHKDNPLTPLLDRNMQERDEKGRIEYGVPLTPFNHRSNKQDYFEELLDALVYKKNDLIEQGKDIDEDYLTVLKLAIKTKGEL